MPSAIVAILIGYLLGSIPFGFWIVKAVKGIDIRQFGSGSTGATNVWRCMGLSWALIVFFLDIFKGYLAVFIAIYLQDIGYMNDLPFPELYLIPAIAAISSLIGHSKSIFLNFQGGKSAATALGCAIAMNIWASAESFSLWLIVLGIGRMVSLASICAVCASGLLMFLNHAPIGYIAYCVCGAIFITYRHKANIQRMLSGTEPRIGERSKT